MFKWLKKYLSWLRGKSDGITFGDELTIEHFRDGKLIDKRVIKGKCPTNAGFAAVAARVGGITEDAFTRLALGTGSTGEVPANTALEAEITTGGLERTQATVSRVQTYVPNDTLQLLHEWTATATHLLREIGAFNAAAGGDMLARKTYALITVNNTDHVKMTYKFPFSAA